MQDQSAETHQEQSTTQILVNEQDNKFSLRLELHNNGMECYGAIISNNPAKKIKPKHVLKALKKSSVTVGIREQEVVGFCEQAVRNPPVANFMLAAGRPPGPGKDGWLELSVKLADDEVQLEEDEHGRIDYRNQYFFSSVEPGDEIGVVHPPSLGTPGVTVLGQEVSSTLGEPLHPRVGEGVRFEEEGGRLLAEMQGRVIADGDMVSISEEYVVPGDVDLSVGHIDFNGFVEVRGDVLDEFNIRAGKGIKVHGNVGVCKLESDGNIQINGMAGKGKGRIQCRGNLVALFLNAVMVESHGDVVIQNEIRNCHVFSEGAIIVSTGVIVGGDCIAFKGIEAKTVGATSGVPTRLTAGFNYLEFCEENPSFRKIKELEQEIASIEITIGPVSKQDLESGSVSADVKKLYIRLQELKASKAELDSSMEHQIMTSKGGVCQVNVNSMLNEKAIISLGKTIEEIKIEQQGPVSIVEALEEGMLQIIPQQNLPTASS
jgi:uncharacterized protein (DUF342 family)